MTSLYSDYTNLANYLEGQQFGPKSSVPTPDMAYPILPENRVNYGYRALTHDSTPYPGYYNIESGYGSENKCTTFNIGSCPSNMVVRPYAPAPSAPSVEGFQYGNGAMNAKSARAQLKALDVVMYTQDNCKYCADVLKDLDLRKNCPNLKIKNIKDKKNLQEFLGYGGQGVPFFVATKTGKTYTGHPRSLDVLVGSLQMSSIPTETNDLRAILKGLDVKLLLDRRCGYCKKLRSMLDQNGVSDVVVMYWNSDPEARDVFGHLTIDGVPVIYSVKTGKHIVGAPASLSQIISALN